MENDSRIPKSRHKGLYPAIIPDVLPEIDEQKKNSSYKIRFFSRLNRKDARSEENCDKFVPTSPQRKLPDTYPRSKSFSSDGSYPHSNWVCPNDRQLMLRAKLRIGWSVKAELYEKHGCQLKPLSDSEQQAISSVIKRAEALDKQEQERIGRLVERLDNMKRHALGSGAKHCALCDDKFGFLSSSPMICHDCRKAVCNKCGIETTSAKKEQIWLCKICAETREMWKKSGAWFYKSLPKYVLPAKTEKYPSHYRLCELDPLWSKIPVEESSSEDEIKTTISAPSRYRGHSSNNISPTSPGSMKNAPAGSVNSLTTSLKGARVTISEPGPNHGYKYRSHGDRSHRSESVVEPNSNRALSAESFGNVPQILVNSCNHDVMSNPDSLESDNSSSRSILAAGSGLEEVFDEETSPTDFSPKTDSSMGTISLSIQYDADANSLHIFLRNATGLKGTDINQLSDPFCKLNLLPVGAKSYRLKTKTIPKTLNPEFNETLTFYGITDQDVLTQSLHILILDDDKYGHDCLGEAKFLLSKLRPRITRDLQLNLEKHIPNESEDEIWGEGRGANGQIVLRLMYSTKKKALIVTIVRCHNLLPMDSNGLSDPFVKLWLKWPEGSTPKYKTNIRWKNLNPVYNEEFAIPTPMNDISRKTLIITVWDKDPGRSNDYLGCLELGRNSKGDRLRQWLDMMYYPDHSHEGTHNLSEELIKNGVMN